MDHKPNLAYGLFLCGPPAKSGFYIFKSRKKKKKKKKNIQQRFYVGLKA